MSGAGTHIVTAAAAERLAERCSPRDWAILETANQLRLVSGLQLERLHFAELSGKSRAVTRWRVLHRLVEWRAIAPLDRRVGGAARGSAGAVYALDAAGHRLLRLRHAADEEGARVRRPYTPGQRKLRHTLAVSELFVSLTERSTADGFVVEAFHAEPTYSTPGGWLSPDAYLVLATGDVADAWWIEVDLATESVPTVQKKIEAYATFYRQGQYGRLGVMPRVLVAVPDERRKRQLTERLVRNSDAEQLVRITLQDEAVPLLVAVLLAVDDDD